jgi:hypothetical protein
LICALKDRDGTAGFTRRRCNFQSDESRADNNQTNTGPQFGLQRESIVDTPDVKNTRIVSLD